MADYTEQPGLAQIPAGSVVITPAEIYAETRATHEAVQRIEAAVSPLPKQIADHEERLRKLEHWIWRASGVAAAVGIAAGAASNYVTR